MSGVRRGKDCGRVLAEKAPWSFVCRSFVKTVRPTGRSPHGSTPTKRAKPSNEQPAMSRNVPPRPSTLQSSFGLLWPGEEGTLFDNVETVERLTVRRAV